MQSPNHSDRANSTSVSSSNSTASMNTATQVLEPHCYWEKCHQPKHNLCVSFYIQSIVTFIPQFCNRRLKSWGQSLWAAVPIGQQLHHQGMILKPSSGIRSFVYYLGQAKQMQTLLVDVQVCGLPIIDFTCKHLNFIFFVKYFVFFGRFQWKEYVWIMHSRTDDF